MGQGKVYWITGLSNTGKSTLGRLLTRRLRENGRQVVFLDGDELRVVYGASDDFGVEDRRRIAFRNARLCALLASQGFDVVCATISLFHEVQLWSRTNIPHYLEIYLESPPEVLKQRDQRGIYSDSRGVPGVDWTVETPQRPDLQLQSHTHSPDELLERVWEKFGTSAHEPTC